MTIYVESIKGRAIVAFHADNDQISMYGANRIDIGELVLTAEAGETPRPTCERRMSLDGWSRGPSL
jgi:hypothetical protein